MGNLKCFTCSQDLGCSEYGEVFPCKTCVDAAFEAGHSEGYSECCSESYQDGYEDGLNDRKEIT